MLPGTYPPLYYPGHGVVTQVPTWQGMMYQPLGMRLGSKTPPDLAFNLLQFPWLVVNAKILLLLEVVPDMLN